MIFDVENSGIDNESRMKESKVYVRFVPCETE